MTPRVHTQFAQAAGYFCAGFLGIAVGCSASQPDPAALPDPPLFTQGSEITESYQSEDGPVVSPGSASGSPAVLPPVILKMNAAGDNVTVNADPTAVGSVGVYVQGTYADGSKTNKVTTTGAGAHGITVDPDKTLVSMSVELLEGSASKSMFAYTLEWTHE